MILRPLSGDEAELRRIQATPEVVALVGRPGQGFPWTRDDSAVTRQVSDEELEPKYRHAGSTCSSIPRCTAEASAPRRCGVVRL